MHKLLILLPVILAACMAAAPETYGPFEVAPVAQETGWAGCEAAGGSFATGGSGGLVCVTQ